MIRRLRGEFIRIAMLAVTLVLLLLTVSVNAVNYISVSRQQDRTLEMIVSHQGTIPAMPKEAKSGPRPNGHFSPETPYDTRFFVLRYTDSGDLTQSDLTHIASVTEADTEPYLQAALSHGEGSGWQSGYRFRVVQTGENRWMAVFLDCRKEVRSLYRLAGVSVAVMAVCVALVYLIVVRLSRRAMEPVVQSVQRQKQFITDAGHELKTPITVIATSLRLLEMEVGQQKWLEKAQNQTERLKELVNSLVTLSRMDEEESPLKLSDFAVSEAVEETAESFRDFARSQGHPLELAIVPGLTYCGDEYAVRQLVSILLDNAVKYALPETAIRFVLEKGKRGVVLRCSNACTPLAEGETEKLFDRFYRSDQARSADGSFGVGLSIARSIAEGHRGFIRAQCPQPGEIVFTAQLR